jgi:hypothetical protein
MLTLKSKVFTKEFKTMVLEQEKKNEFIGTYSQDHNLCGFKLEKNKRKISMDL